VSCINVSEKNVSTPSLVQIDGSVYDEGYGHGPEYLLKWIYGAACYLLQLAARRDELEVRKRGLGSEVDLDVADWRQDLVSVVVGVALRMLTVAQAHLVARQHREQVPLELQQGVALARTQRAEPHHRVLHLLTELEELGVHKTVVLELLQQRRIVNSSEPFNTHQEASINQYHN